MLRNGPNARAKSSTDDASWTCPAEGSEKIRERRQNCFRQPGHSPDTSGENHESVAVLAERGRRRAPRFGGFHQAEPTRSATVGDRVYSGVRSYERTRARFCPKARCISPRASRIGSPTREPARRPCASLTGYAIGRRPSPPPSELPTEDARGRRRPVDPSTPPSSLRTEPA